MSYAHVVGRDTDVRPLFRREFRLLIVAVAAVWGLPLSGGGAVEANLDVVRGVALSMRAKRLSLFQSPRTACCAGLCGPCRAPLRRLQGTAGRHRRDTVVTLFREADERG